LLKKNYDVIIVGGGPAGLAATISCAEQGVKDILLLERNFELGGILNQCIHNGFGLQYFKEELTGPEYAERFIKQIKKYKNIQIITNAFVTDLTPDKKITFYIPGEIVKTKGKAVILATGCRERTREMISIPGDRPAGIMTAGMAQKLINIDGLLPGKEVVVIGSGDIGLIMARRFIWSGSKVNAVLEIEEKPAGLQRNIMQCLEDFNIPLLIGHQVSRIRGKNRVESIEVKDIKKKKTFNIKCDTVLLSVGLIQENELLEKAVGINKTKEFFDVSLLKENNKTIVPGIFSCGNCYQIYDLVDKATITSERTGRLAAEYINSPPKSPSLKIPSSKRGTIERPSMQLKAGERERHKPRVSR